ncbi:MAG: hypothetical protein QOE22_52 [Candidatus Parcubacteria bacterium]|jgi:hypothetical protein|nr:hypothetical protein [Candidatus Parcubacteria bacterium]
MERDWKELLDSRLDTFWGYGNLDGKHWFVGMEEGHDLDMESLKGRLKDTQGKSIVDIVEGNPSFVKKLRWFVPPAPPIQRTYKGYIAIQLFLELGRMPTTIEIREYQLTRLGRTYVDGLPNDHAILELMPLPAPSLAERHWPYGNLGIAGLENRKKYLATYKPVQCEKLKAMIEDYKPALVVFYSLTYLGDWQRIVPGKLEEVADRQFVYEDAGTIYCVLPHPVSRNIRNADWETWGKELLRRL